MVPIDGVPVEIHQQEQVYVVKKKTDGRNVYGAKLTNTVERMGMKKTTGLVKLEGISIFLLFLYAEPYGSAVSDRELTLSPI